MIYKFSILSLFHAHSEKKRKKRKVFRVECVRHLNEKLYTNFHHPQSSITREHIFSVVCSVEGRNNKRKTNRAAQRANLLLESFSVEPERYCKNEAEGSLELNLKMKCRSREINLGINEKVLRKQKGSRKFILGLKVLWFIGNSSNRIKPPSPAFLTQIFTYEKVQIGSDLLLKFFPFFSTEGNVFIFLSKYSAERKWNRWVKPRILSMHVRDSRLLKALMQTANVCHKGIFPFSLFRREKSVLQRGFWLIEVLMPFLLSFEAC